MKYYSDLTKEFYETEKECQKAELVFNTQKKLEEEKKQKAEKKAKEEALAVSKEKKELAKAVEVAESNLNQAYEKYELAKKEARKMIDEAESKAKEILAPAKEEIQKAQEAKFNAVSEFSKRYGAYTTTYTGDRALRELQRANNWINDIFRGFFF